MKVYSCICTFSAITTVRNLKCYCFKKLQKLNKTQKVVLHFLIFEISIRTNVYVGACTTYIIFYTYVVNYYHTLLTTIILRNNS